MTTEPATTTESETSEQPWELIAAKVSARFPSFKATRGVVSQEKCWEALDVLIALEPTETEEDYLYALSPAFPEDDQDPLTPTPPKNYQDPLMLTIKAIEKTNQEPIAEARATIRHFGEQIEPRTLANMREVYDSFRNSKRARNHPRGERAVDYICWALNAGWDGIGDWNGK